MDRSGAAPGLVRCDNCGTIAHAEVEVTCCDRPMDPIQPPEPVEVSLEEVLRFVFDMSESALDICLCVMAGGEQTVSGLAEETGYDRSVIARHVSHLVELGVLDKRRRLLEQGGHVYVYTPREADAVRRSFRARFLAWVDQASARIETMSREKVEAIVEAGANDPQWTIYQE